MAAAVGVAQAPSAHHLVPMVPPPPIPSPLRKQQRFRQGHGDGSDALPEPLQPLKVSAPVPAPAAAPPQPPSTGSPGTGPISRYRCLRGKSVSSVHRNKTFDVFVDAEEAPPTPTPPPLQALRRRSKSAASPSPNPGRISRGDLQALRAPSPTANASANSVSATASASPGVSANANANGAPIGNAIGVANGNPNPNPNSSLNPAHPAALTLKSVNHILQLSSTNPKAKLDSTRASDLAHLKAFPLPGKGRQTPPKGHPAITDQDESARWADEVARLEAETDRILAEQKKRDLARLQAQLATAAATPKPKPKPRRLILDKLTLPLFTKSSRSSANAGSSSERSSPSPSTPTRGSPLSPRTFPLVWSPGTTNFDGSPSSETASMAYFEYSGAAGLTSAQMDAPIAASNGGERRITVRCLSATINLPVTPETTPRDIIYSTANFITQTVEPANCVLIECDVMCGLERRVRKYERIRDIMNSWDRDQQNSLLVVPYDSLPDERDIELAHVPKTEEPPLGFTFQLYHASRPGNWSKRWVTLMETGQIFAAKRPETKCTDKDGVTLCHLSDFDIYTPREGEMRRHLRPPKKHCYAIKSQQKSNAFPNGENFIHFFSTEDPKLASRFYELIQGWRSWYLANKKIDLDDRQDLLKRSMSVSQKSTKPKISTEENPYMIGDFKPLIDMERFDKPIEEFGKDLPAEALKPEPQHEPKEAAVKPKKALTKAQPAAAQAPALPTSPASPTSGPEGEFLAGGLLGDAYDKRKQAEPAVTTEVKKIEGPFTEGPSLLNSVMSGAKSVASTPEKPEPPSWFPSAAEHTARARSVSAPRGPPRRPTTADNNRHRMPQPLLGNGYANMHGPPPPMPQGRLGGRPGKGRGVKPPPNGTPLIDLANGQPMPTGPPTSRSASRVNPAAVPGGPNQPRRRATATSSRHGPGYAPADRPPVPPVPDRSVRRPDQRIVSPTTHSHHSREQRPEPLINRAR